MSLSQLWISVNCQICKDSKDGWLNFYFYLALTSQICWGHQHSFLVQRYQERKTRGEFFFIRGDQSNWDQIWSLQHHLSSREFKPTLTKFDVLERYQIREPDILVNRQIQFHGTSLRTAPALNLIVQSLLLGLYGQQQTLPIAGASDTLLW